MSALALLALSDGAVFAGTAFGARATVIGEVVFNTCLTGYQEVITDPSYQGQMVCLTVPHVGNTGINGEDLESSRPRIRALVVREISRVVSNWRADTSLPEWLRSHGVPGISEVDTRLLTRKIREQGVMHAALCSDSSRSADELCAMAAAWPGLAGRDLVREVTCATPYQWQADDDALWWAPPPAPGLAPVAEGDGEPPRVVAYDYGIKRNILRHLARHGLKVTVVPAQTSADEALALDPDGLFLSNGPGDPSALPYAAECARRLMESGIPLFGICLGHQIIARALGAETYKLKFGHHGGNQPVSDLEGGRVQITSQNHNYSVDPEGLPANARLTHWNLNDRTLAGIRLTDRPVFSVQYHPEASPGPHDADALFAEFARMVWERAFNRR